MTVGLGKSGKLGSFIRHLEEALMKPRKMAVMFGMSRLWMLIDLMEGVLRRREVDPIILVRLSKFQNTA
jgi:hypothetical protein